MPLDANTLIVVNVANELILATTLPLIMGAELSEAAIAARRALIVQAMGWIALIVSGLWPETIVDRVLSTFSMACISAANWLLFQSFTGWMGPRPHEKALAYCAVAMPVGYFVLFSSYPARVAWANLLIAAQLLLAARACLAPSTALGGRWRWIMLIGLLVMAVLTAARGVLGGWFTNLYPNFTAPNPMNLAALLAANVTLVMINVSVLVAWREEAELQLRTLATTDQLTGLLNRHGWLKPAALQIAHARRHGLPLALMSIDLDHFKQINDKHGHDGGDKALRLFGRLLKQGQRSGDLIARMGGEEFCVLMPQADFSTGQGFDRRLRAALEAAAASELGFSLTYSSGLTTLPEQGDSLERLMSQADAALYEAKHSGRAKLVCWPELKPSDLDVPHSGVRQS